MKTSLGETPVATFLVTYEAGELLPEETTLRVTIDLSRIRPLALRTRWSNLAKATSDHGIVVVERVP